jgi:sigma-B regulation protein RsbU (phosphoserine phosphatase)
MEQLLDNAPCGFLVFSDDGKIIEVNATLLNVLGYGRHEVHNLHLEKIFSVSGRIFYQTHFFPLLKLKRKVGEVYLSLRSKNGEEIPVLTNAQRRVGRDGRVFNDCVFVAIRQRNKYEDEILAANKEAEESTRALHEKVQELEAALDQVKQLQGILPICSYCKHVRDDQNYWQQVETYISLHSEAVFSHSICPACYQTEVQPQLDKLKFNRVK